MWLLKVGGALLFGLLQADEWAFGDLGVLMLDMRVASLGDFLDLKLGGW